MKRKKKKQYRRKKRTKRKAVENKEGERKERKSRKAAQKVVIKTEKMTSLPALFICTNLLHLPSPALNLC